MTVQCQRVILGILGWKRQETPYYTDPQNLKEPTSTIKNEKGASSSSTHQGKLCIRENEI